MNVIIEQPKLLTRSSDGIIAGVCSGIAKRWSIDPWLLRLGLALSILLFGTGLLVYVMLWVSLPSEEHAYQAYEKRVLGVCSRISLATGVDVGLVRFLAIGLALGSFGATIIGYVILYFVVPESSTQSLIK